MKQPKNNYVRNKELHDELVKYHATGTVSEELAQMLMIMAQSIGNRKQFRSYTYLDDMVSESVLTCLKYMHNFNPDRNTNAFSYISTIIFNSFKLSIKREKKHSSIKDSMYKQYVEDLEEEISNL